MSVTVTVPEAISKLRAFSEDAWVAVARSAISRAVGAGRKQALDRLKRSTVGRAVARRGKVAARQAKALGWSKADIAFTKKTGIPLIVKKSPLKERNDLGAGRRTFSGGIETMGFAALIETGGRTKSHSIKPIRAEGYSRKRSKRAAQLAAAGHLTFQIGGRWVSVKTVTHPGSRIPRNPFMESAGRKAEDVLGPELEIGLQKAAVKLGL